MSENGESMGVDHHQENGETLDAARMDEIRNAALAKAEAEARWKTLTEALTPAERAHMGIAMPGKHKTQRPITRGEAHSNSSESSDSTIVTQEIPKKSKVMYRTAKVPKPEHYSMKQDEIHPFEDFLSEFEKYCSYVCGTEKRKWLRELGRYLHGKIAREYDELVCGRMTYAEVIEHLRTAVAECRENRMSDGVAKFHSARIQPSESTHRFAIRLQVLAKELKLDTAATEEQLVSKFLNSIPKKLRKSMNERLHLRQVTAPAGQSKWVTLRKILRYDVDSDDESDDSLDNHWDRRSRSTYRSRDRNSEEMDIYLADDGQSSRTVYCRHCGIRGHQESSCRRKNGQCLACGRSDHDLNSCQLRRNRSKSPFSRQPRNRSITGNCFNCGLPGHRRATCGAPPRMSGSMSGQSNHTSVQENIRNPSSIPVREQTMPATVVPSQYVTVEQLQEFQANIMSALNNMAPRNQGHARSEEV